jgi:glc operon protein GlcG
MNRMFLAAVAAIALTASAGAQQLPVSYGNPITLEQAKTIVAAAERSAQSRNFTMAFAVVEPSGELVLFHKMDGTQYGSELVAREKARTAARFKRSTKAFSDSVAGGRNAVLSLPGVVAIEGGTPIVINGRIVGAIGVSGGSSEQDGEVAAAALLGLE